MGCTSHLAASKCTINDTQTQFSLGLHNIAYQHLLRIAIFLVRFLNLNEFRDLKHVLCVLKRGLDNSEGLRATSLLKGLIGPHY